MGPPVARGVRGHRRRAAARVRLRLGRTIAATRQAAARDQPQSLGEKARKQAQAPSRAGLTVLNTSESMILMRLMPKSLRSQPRTRVVGRVAGADGVAL